MTKKRRVRRKAKPNVPTNAPAPVEESEAQRAHRRGASAEELKQEYAYVVKDLRRVFFTAALMFALLIILNLVLR